MRGKRARLLRQISGYNPHGPRKMVSNKITGQVFNLAKIGYSDMKKAVQG